MSSMTNLTLPSDTSSGKSSLLSSISNIELPSSDELTTRCPIMLQMRRSEEQSAEVSIVWKDKPTGKSEKELKFNEIGVRKKNWSKLTEAIANAQKHIIEKTGKEVARDVVRVKVAGPFCEDLTLIDLPGIVRAVGAGESETLSEDIQSLIDDYLKNSRCVILAVHPSNVDFHNSQIMADARKVDPQTKRTIPVLTKPDLIDKGAESGVRDLLLGMKTDAFEKGFHMVKGRGQMSLNQSHTIEKGVQDEEVFFRNTQPWRDVTDRSIFGTSELRKKLGDIQMHMVRETFPAVVQELKSQKEATILEVNALGMLPSSLAEKRMVFFEVKDNLVKHTKALLTGTNLRDLNFKASGVYSAKIHTEYGVFRDEIAKGSLCREFDNSNLKEKIANARTCSSLPIFLSPEVFESIVSDSVEENWRNPSLDVLDRVSALLCDAVRTVVENERQFKHFPRLRLFVERNIEHTLDNSVSMAREKIIDFVCHEKVPYSQNHYLNENFAKLRSTYLQEMMEDAFAESDGSTFRYNTVIAIIKGVFETNQRMSPDDHMAQDMGFALISYGKVASKRFIDTVPMICQDMIMALPNEIDRCLWKISDEDLTNLVSGSKDAHTKRKHLKRKLDDLVAGLDIFETLI